MLYGVSGEALLYGGSEAMLYGGSEAMLYGVSEVMLYGVSEEVLLCEASEETQGFAPVPMICMFLQRTPSIQGKRQMMAV
ncbi:hypothetical protein ATCVWI0606_684L [Acanthocystis turfacea Chlorella virus WI0606]|nr:hypothetical protein ATCVWI0606_684L [Acanthocystis turfacea Chlorella virus WI0606]